MPHSLALHNGVLEEGGVARRKLAIRMEEEIPACFVWG
jgi:hypothetical protein